MINQRKGLESIMLAKFQVENFKNFKEKIVLDLEKKKSYEFNQQVIRNDIIRAGIIYGENASGKSNLGNAILDITLHLTDTEKGLKKYSNYLNMDSNKKYAEFYYLFIFDDAKIEYSYKKTSATDLLEETFCINSEKVIFYNYITNEALCNLDGAENINTNLGDKRISFLKYIDANTVLNDTDKNLAYKSFMKFVNKMLLFYSLESNHYHGFFTGNEDISEGIIKRNKLKEFEEFLNDVGIECSLIPKKVNDSMEIYTKHKNNEVNLFSLASTGTKSLSLFFYWLIQMDEISFVFMDEFDAFYHYELAVKVVEYVLKKTNLQVLFTSHNLNLMSNELLRPDCYFELKNGKIDSLADLTDKELRKAHNLQKMYKAGAFSR